MIWTTNLSIRNQNNQLLSFRPFIFFLQRNHPIDKHIHATEYTSVHAKNFFWRIIDMPFWEELFKILLYSIS